MRRGEEQTKTIGAYLGRLDGNIVPGLQSRVRLLCCVLGLFIVGNPLHLERSPPWSRQRCSVRKQGQRVIHGKQGHQSNPGASKRGFVLFRGHLADRVSKDVDHCCLCLEDGSIESLVLKLCLGDLVHELTVRQMRLWPTRDVLFVARRAIVVHDDLAFFVDDQRRVFFGHARVGLFFYSDHPGLVAQKNLEKSISFVLGQFCPVAWTPQFIFRLAESDLVFVCR